MVLLKKVENSNIPHRTKENDPIIREVMDIKQRVTQPKGESTAGVPGAIPTTFKGRKK